MTGLRAVSVTSLEAKRNQGVTAAYAGHVDLSRGHEGLPPAKSKDRLRIEFFTILLMKFSD